jgi:hypothetical protein
MTVMIPQFFGVPPQIMRDGLCKRLRPTEIKLYLALLHDSERYRTRELKRTDAKICELVGGSSRALCNARKRLQEFGLLKFDAGRGNVYQYVICNPETGEPWPGPARLPVPYVKKSDASSKQAPPVADYGSAPTERQSYPAASNEDRPPQSYGLPGIFPKRRG